MTTSASLSGRRVVVIGGGITGLAAAVVLGRRGAEVEVIERDPVGSLADRDAAFFAAERPSVPQLRHSHVFLGRLRNLLRDHYPALLAELMDAGAREIDGLQRPPQPLRGMPRVSGDEQLVIIACRRTTFEWVLRRHAESMPGVRFLSGARVRDLIGIGGRQPVVAGVTVEIGGRLEPRYAHLVVDASGRRSEAPQWLAGLGTRPVRETSEPSGIIYYTRFYRLREGASEPPPSDIPLAADLDWLKYAIFPADAGTFSITLAVPLSESKLKVLAHATAFDTMVGLIPGLGAWVDPEIAEPLEAKGRGVHAMGGLINRLRRFVDRRGPVALRFFALGDAAYCTNPLYGRGCSQGFLHAHFLGEALDAHADDLDAAARTLDRRAREELDPFYRASILADREATRRAEGRTPSTWSGRLRSSFFRDGVVLALRHDPVVYRAFLRMMNMLETPEAAFARADVAVRCLWYMARSDFYRSLDPLPVYPERLRAIVACQAAARAGGRTHASTALA